MAMGAKGALEPGAIFAEDFRIERPLSAGGMGAVYVALQLSTGRQRALKLMLPQLVADPKLRARFEQEARIGSRIESEHVVEVVAAGLDRATGTPFIAMELLRGQDLGALVKRAGALEASFAVETVAQLCHAVGAAHAAGIVHRDLKPENVFIAETRRRGTSHMVKVLDFGIAKLVAEASTAHTAALGTPMWMAPEQTASGASIGPQADVWAIGLIAFHVLTGRYFWRAAEEEGASVAQLLRESVLEPLPPASQRARDVGQATALPPGFDRWFARSLDRSAGERYADANVQCEAFRAMFDEQAAAMARTDVALAYVGSEPPAGMALAPTEPHGHVAVLAKRDAHAPASPVVSTTGAVTALPQDPAASTPDSREGPARWRGRLVAPALLGVAMVSAATTWLVSRERPSAGPLPPVAVAASATPALVPLAGASAPGSAAGAASVSAGNAIDGGERAVVAAPHAPLSSSSVAVAVAPRLPGASTPREKLLAAVASLKQGAYYRRMTVGECMSAYRTYARYLPEVKMRDADDDDVKFAAANVRQTAPACLGRAGDCDQAWQVYKSAWKLDPLLSEQQHRFGDDTLRPGFEAVTRSCAKEP
jgi:hypothetical protein